MPERLPERGKSDEEDRIAKIQRRGKVQDREKNPRRNARSSEARVEVPQRMGHCNLQGPV